MNNCRQRAWIVAIVAVVLGLLAPAARALTITSAATGNWNAVATWAIVTAGIPGTITTVNGSATVTGNATQFLQLKPGDQIYTNASVLIGTISAVASDTSLTLTAAATANRNNVTYRIRKVPDANDAVNVGTTAAHTVTVPNGVTSSASSLTIGNTGVNGVAAVTLANTSTLNVTGAVSINRPSNNARTNALNVGANTATMGSLSLLGGAGTRASEISISTGMATVTGNISFSGTASNALITFSGAGTLRVGGTLGTGGTLTPSTGTVQYHGAGAQTIATDYSYYNLTLATSGTKTPDAGALTVAGTLTVDSGVTYEGSVNNPAVNVAGDFSDSGTFNSGTGLFTFAGTNHALTGTNTGTTFTDLRINSTGTLTLSHDATVNGTLTFSNGRISTGANVVALGTAGTIATPGASSYVVGNFRKAYAASANLNFVGDDFPVGDATNYTPVNITAGTTTTAGTLTVSTTATDHPQVTTPIPSTGIDATLSVNRYWRFISNGVTTGTDIAATFHFITGTPVDLDAAAQTFNFIVQRYDQSVWHQTTLNAASADNTQVGGIAIGTGTHDFAIGQPLPGGGPAPVGRFNVFQSTTAANSLEGKIFTKQAGVSVTDLDIIQTNPSKTNYQGGSVTVEIELLDATSGGATDSEGCSSTDSWPLVQTLPNFTFTSRGTLPGFTVVNSYRNLRFRVRFPVGGPYTRVGCSQDNFAVRPQSITVSAHDLTWQTAYAGVGTPRALNNTSAAGGNVHAASTGTRPFTLRAVAQPSATVTLYDGSPTIVSGFPTCGSLCTSLSGTPLGYTANMWTGAGTRENATAHFAEAGTFNLQLEDTEYANVDAFDGSTATMRTIPITGALSVEIGRFVPDHFDVMTGTTPTFRTFDSICAGTRTFTYIGAPFRYATTPTVTITAKNAAGDTTTNYQGALWKIGGATPSTSKDCTSNPDVCVFTTEWTPTPKGKVIESYSYTLTPASTPNWDDGGAAPSAASVTDNMNGTGSVTFATSGSLAFKRNATTPQAEFRATNITDTISVQDDTEAAVSGNGTITTSSSAVFANISFDGSGLTPDTFRYGRLRLSNVAGPSNVDVPVPLRAEYYVSAASGFMLNAADNCTTLAAGNFKLSGHQGGITLGNMPDTNVSISGAFAAGIGNLKLLKSNATTPGSVRICLDLDTTSAVGDTTCQGATSAADQNYLQGPWTGSTYDKDPRAQATFGLYGSQPRNFIFFRENY